MISSQELGRIVEAAFLPMKGVCSIAADGSMTIQIFNPETEKEELTVVGIDTAALGSIRDIVALVLEVQEEMRLRRLARDYQANGRRA